MMLSSVTTHAMIAVKDLVLAKEFYSERLGLTSSDKSRRGALRYETQGKHLVLGLPIRVRRDCAEHMHEV